MRAAVIAPLVLALGLIHPISMSFLPKDLEGSGYDLDSSGSGSGDWSEQGEVENIKDPPNRKDEVNTGCRTKNTLHGSSGLTFGNKHWPAKDSGSRFVVMANTKSFMENKEMFAGVIAGGVTGVTLAVILAAILIYKWQKKEDGGYIQGQQRASD